MIKPKSIFVYADWVGLPQPTLMGVLSATLSRGKEIMSFEYDAQWLSNHAYHSLDPALQLFHGPQYPKDNQDNFGLFLDSSPDRWGRFLMNRRESQIAKQEKRAARKLLESDYLLGVYDEHRMGALRFKTNPTGPFLDHNKAYSAPPYTELQTIEHACLSIEKENAETKSDYLKWLTMLIAPGGSLGGARPKASVVDKQKHPWIAKFPSSHDEFDIGAWEMVAQR